MIEGDEDLQLTEQLRQMKRKMQSIFVLQGQFQMNQTTKRDLLSLSAGRFKMVTTLKYLTTAIPSSL